MSDASPPRSCEFSGRGGPTYKEFTARPSRPTSRRSTESDGWIVDLFDAHYLALVRLAVQFVDTQESAEEVVQDVFTAVYRRGRDAAPTDPERYLKRAVVNRSRSMLRWRSAHARLVRSAASELRLRPNVNGEASSAVDAVQRSIESLPRRQREVLVMRYYEGLDPTEVARILRIRRGAVNSSLHRALETLRTLLTDEVSK